MTAAQREAWNTFIAMTQSRLPAAQAAVDRHTQRLNQAEAASKAGLARQAAKWLAAATRNLNEIDAILAADAELLRLRGQEG